MIQFVGCVFILLAGIGVGHTYSKELEKGLSQMLEIRKMIHMLQWQIQYEKLPIGECLNKISEKSNGIYKVWFKEMSEDIKKGNKVNLSKIWEEKTELHMNSKYISKSDLFLIKRLGNDMGGADLKSELGILSLFIEQWNKRIEVYDLQLKSKQKLSRTFGVLGSLFLIILFL